jgi:hypothetical protein
MLFLFLPCIRISPTVETLDKLEVVVEEVQEVIASR